MHNVRRVNDLRLRLDNEIQSAIRLSRQFTQPIFVQDAKRLSSDADEFSESFLGSSLDEWRPEQMEKATLDGVERSIYRLFTARREELERILRDYGRNAIIAGRPEPVRLPC